MTYTPKYLLEPVSSLDEIRGFHHNSTPADKRMGGLEEEIFLHSSKDGLPLAVHDQNVRLEQNLCLNHPRIDPDAVSLEPGSHMIETKTIAFFGRQQNCIINQIELRRSIMLDKCTEEGLIRSPYSSLPHVTPKEALDNIIRRVEGDPLRGDRQIMLMDVFRKQVKAAAHYPVYSVGAQYTHGVSNADELLEIKRVLNALAPLIYNIFDNSSPFIGGQKQTVHPVIDLRKLLSRSGPIDRTVFDAKDGNDYVERKIDYIFKKPLFVTHDEEGRYVTVEEGKKVTFGDWFDQGKGTKLLYLIAQLQGWPFLKDKLFHSEEKGFHSIGNEVRDLGNGPAAPSMAVALFQPLVFNASFRKQVMELLEQEFRIPLNSNPAVAFKVIQSNLTAAHYRQAVPGSDPSVFLNAPLGSNGRSQLDLLRSLVPMLEQVHRWSVLADVVAPLAFIARTGLTDTQFFHDTQPTLQDTLDFMDPDKGYSHEIFQSSSRTMGQLFSEGYLHPLQVKPQHAVEVRKKIDGACVSENSPGPALKMTGPV